ncbi:SDR family NAD(P)-dependent oxidoreductase [Listeria booriae]|uniref:SDR family NAD(P)-dependent oxidoreductase n=1 Tax=Listeria booriae TaxID=1552123 RepID=UPI0016235DF8|nr:SDR family NAD(P)-dependent oxidoreductase [Listeria booriae]MBC2676736.1 polysaccharide biosynthesis protein [Listeria booriae]
MFNDTKANSPYFLKLLLDREYMPTYRKSTHHFIKQKTILITGAGGSIGSEICRQLLKYDPAKMILVGHGENSIYKIYQELSGKSDIPIDTHIVEIQNKERVDTLFEETKPDYVFHVAAHKHVPLMEKNPHSAIENNLIGTMNLAEASGRNYVRNFILVSTDKAANPQNVMGATKKLAEKSLLHFQEKYLTNYAAVRFGNVLDSRGSVIPLFMEQIMSGGTITITHPEMTRYFMSIEEAAELVIEANPYIVGGEIFILKMGGPIKITEIAERLIQKFGKKDTTIEFTGIRPGEKIHEELLEETEKEGLATVGEMLIGQASPFDFKLIEMLRLTYKDKSEQEIRQFLLNIANNKNIVEVG